MTKFSIQAIYKNPKWTGKTVAELQRLQSLIDLRHRKSQDSCYMKYGKKSDAQCDSRIIINVSGLRFETFKSTLERYPRTLLGNNQRRSLFYDKKSDEYFFDRHRLCFESILYYYQSRGRLRRPENVPLDTFLEELIFFDLGHDALMQVRKEEDLEEAQKIQLPQNRCLRHLWANLEYPQYSMTAKIINLFSIIFILLSAIELAIETLPDYNKLNGGLCEQGGDGLLINSNNNTSLRFLCPPNFHSPFFIIQSICIAFFTLEFVLRLISCPSYLSFVKSIANWIDFLAIAPYYITLAINILGFRKEISPTAELCLSLLRIFRFIRIFKLYRIFQHVKSLRVLGSTLKESIPDFVILLSFLTISGFLFGAAIYFAENDFNGTFDSIPKATYFGIITLTAVGYGDISPTTGLGRSLACFGAIYGISIVSMLVSVLVGRYQQVYSRKRFFNDNGSENKILNDSLLHISNNDKNNSCRIGTEENMDNGSLTENMSDKNEENIESSGKVHFIIGYVTDDEEDNIQDENDNIDYGNGENFVKEEKLLNKVAQAIFCSSSRMNVVK